MQRKPLNVQNLLGTTGLKHVQHAHNALAAAKTKRHERERNAELGDYSVPRVEHDTVPLSQRNRIPRYWSTGIRGYSAGLAGQYSGTRHPALNATRASTRHGALNPAVSLITGGVCSPPPPLVGVYIDL